MIWKIYLTAILLFFIVAFFLRNVRTSINTGVSIKAKSVKVNTTILLSTLIYLLIILRLIFLKRDVFLELNLSDYKIIRYIGTAFVTLGFALGIVALYAMKDSWRVGIKYEQKTDLVSSGIYKYSRNPYFLSYNILIFGFIVVFPSLFLIIPYLLLLTIFHKMILEEEKYLELVHGKTYLEYKAKVRRYFSIIQ